MPHLVRATTTTTTTTVPFFTAAATAGTTPMVGGTTTTIVTTSTALTTAQDELARDLLAALQDEDLWDVELQSTSLQHDDDTSTTTKTKNTVVVTVPACKFALAARSPVLRRMLYGNFCESTATKIPLPYSVDNLRHIVQYCRHNTVCLAASGSSTNNSSNNITTTEPDMQGWIELASAADYLQLPGLQQQVEAHVSRVMAGTPALACVTYQWAVPGSDLSEAAYQIIVNRPYVALDTGVEPRQPEQSNNSNNNNAGGTGGGSGGSGGGVECLGAERLSELLGDCSIGASELFLWHMLNRWYEHQLRLLDTDSDHDDPDSRRRETALAQAQDMARQLKLEDIEPSDLFGQLQDSPLITPDHLFAAVATQALRASERKTWRLGCRGGGGSSGSNYSNGITASHRAASNNNATQSHPAPQPERVLVENAGCRDANGLYYRIHGLARDLYTKREVSVGQSHVYTLSCTVKHDAAECRIFCSPLLTNQAVAVFDRMQRSLMIDPCFQPVVQLLQILPPRAAAPLPIRKFYQIQISDGNYSMPGTLASNLDVFVENTELLDTSLVKILEFGVYDLAGVTAIHISDLNLVSKNPGQRLGSPVALADLKEAGVAPPLPLTLDDGAGSGHHHKSSSGGLLNLYSCTTPVAQYEAQAKVPSRGWQVDDHGVEPVPICRWIPSTKGEGLVDDDFFGKTGMSPKEITVCRQVHQRPSAPTSPVAAGPARDTGRFLRTLSSVRAASTQNSQVRVIGPAGAGAISAAPNGDKKTPPPPPSRRLG